jgi:hypothetical protein
MGFHHNIKHFGMPFFITIFIKCIPISNGVLIEKKKDPLVLLVVDYGFIFLILKFFSLFDQ